MKRVTFIDLGIGNKGSLKTFIGSLGYSSDLITSAREIVKAKKIILFGVGAFDEAIKNLRKIDGMEDAVKELVQNSGVQILGICVGMQIMFQSSSEGIESGLGLLRGNVKKMNFRENFPVPHIGWNTINLRKESNLRRGLSNDNEFYFSHSYANFNLNNDTLASSNYGEEFVSIAERNNIFGCQFHPEKSYLSGQILMQNFLEL